MKAPLFVLLGLLAGTSLFAQAWKFDRVVNTPYPQANAPSGGDLVVADFNGDGKLDALLTGSLKASPAVFLYLQDGSGFRLDNGHGIGGALAGAMLAAADLDGDGDQDLMMAGKARTANESAFIRPWFNDGKARFTMGPNLGEQLPSEDFEDGPGSWGPDDKGVKGITNGNGWSAGLFSLVDLNADTLPDLVVVGNKGLEGGTDAAGQSIQREWESAAVFLNQGKGSFKLLGDSRQDPDLAGAGLRKLVRACGECTDFDGDGLADLVAAGQANLGPLANPGMPETQRNGQAITEFRKGLGNGRFAPVASTIASPVIDGAMTSGDLNSDGSLDLVLMGNSGKPADPAGGRLLQVWLGNSQGEFSLDSRQSALKAVMSGDLSLGDLDGDGDLDLVVAGNDNTRSLRILENQSGLLVPRYLGKMRDGIGTNSASGGAESDAVSPARIWTGDMDGDGDVDIMLTGTGGVDQFLVFRNRLR